MVKLKVGTSIGFDKQEMRRLTHGEHD